MKRRKVSPELQLIERMVREAMLDRNADPDQCRMLARSVYGALCVVGGIDKKTALSELSAHWDMYEIAADEARLN